MKRILSAAMIFVMALMAGPDLKAQGVALEEELIYLLGSKNRKAASELVRNIRYVDYTDLYDRSLLMYASANGYTNICRILLNKGADPDYQPLDGVTLRYIQWL